VETAIFDPSVASYAANVHNPEFIKAYKQYVPEDFTKNGIAIPQGVTDFCNL